MPQYRYKAFNAEGAALEGVVAAQSEREAARQLERRGLSVVAVQPAEAARRRQRGQVARLRQRDLILAFHELSTLLGAGVGLAEAVAAQVRSVHHPRLVAAFDGIATGLRQGQAFSTALEAAGLPLPRYVATVVRSGEKSGLLGRALHDVVEQMEYDQTVRSEIRQALTYPAVLICAGLGAVVMMFTFVVPKFAALLKRADDLPWLASAVLNTGMFLRQWYAGVLLLVAALVTWLVVVLRNPETRARWLEGLERLPVLGAWRVESETATWARVLATLLSNRVPLMDALGLARASIIAPGRRARLEEVSRNVRNGVPLADALEEQQTLTATGYNLVRVGERSGELPTMLQSLARLCEDSGRTRMKQFLALLEPVAILLIGGAIGVIMIGIILAITSANDIAV
ncbi:type II secretion system F family protein [Stenotrophomonas sp. MYb238]|jgi:general secretion pathway protein F|uniref:type II secretion system F family protein n=1 Tax=Stenotrophomonas sp. MYb238 TaxID=2040281 RepID=UPI001291A858|nr:type II secretion system F family protein [Stenotrophomonas sp. MYb238]MQP77349.1 type II secretion system F family protein [Stenotrophomonas sp. MYb238]